jgi:hypothetical protein
MACPNFKKGLKMAFSPLGVKILLQFLYNQSCLKLFPRFLDREKRTFETRRLGNGIVYCA